MMTGFILAGGRSSRMGRDKALLPIGSQTLIERVIGRIRPLVGQIIVIGHPGNVRSLEERLPDRVLTDLQPGHGPLMGIYTGLMQTETALNLFVPCDMPWVESRVIDRLVEQCRGEIRVAASVHPIDGIQPFPLVCRVEACPLVGALLDQREWSLRALVRQPRARLVPVGEPGLWHAFTSVNTVADYAKLNDEAALPS